MTQPDDCAYVLPEGTVGATLYQLANRKPQKVLDGAPSIGDRLAIVAEPDATSHFRTHAQAA